MKLRYLATMAVVAAFMLASTAQAGLLTLTSGINVFEDDNLEYILDSEGNFKTTGTLEVGDRLRAVITWPQILDGNNNVIQDLGGDDVQLTAISEIEITSITAGGNFIFGASSAFETETGVTGAVAKLYLSSPITFDLGCHSDGTVTTCEDQATTGDHWMTVGFGQAADFWVAAPGLVDPLTGELIPLDSVTLEQVSALAATTKIAVANFSLSILEDFSGYEWAGQFNPLTGAFHDVIGSGDVLGGAGLTSPWIARSDFDFQLYRVPEPATLGLLGLGLVALGFAATRRRTGTA